MFECIECIGYVYINADSPLGKHRIVSTMGYFVLWGDGETPRPFTGHSPLTKGEMESIFPLPKGSAVWQRVLYFPLQNGDTTEFFVVEPFTGSFGLRTHKGFGYILLSQTPRPLRDTPLYKSVFTCQCQVIYVVKSKNFSSGKIY